MSRFDLITRYEAAKPLFNMNTAEYQANADYNETGSNQNPYQEGSKDWIDYEAAFEQRVNEYEFN